MHVDATVGATASHEVVSPASAFRAPARNAATAHAALASLVFALLAGGAASAFALYQAPGVGSLLAATALVVGWTAIARARDREIGRAERAGLAALVVVATLPLFRSSGWLLAYDAIVFVLLAAAIPSLAAGRRGGLSFARAFRAAGRSVGAVARGPLPSLATELDGESLRSRARAPVLGLLFGAPVAFVFFLLFASADPVFADLADDLFDAPTGGRSLAHVLVALSVAWAVAGLAWRAHVTRAEEAGATAVRVAATGARADDAPRDASALLWGLGLVVALFAAFAVTQAVQIVGFADALARSGVTYAGAAREGFFQLLAVTALVVVGVPMASWGARRAEGERGVRLALFVLVGLTTFIAASALLRMARYTDAYGLTELRFHATAAMVSLLGVLAWMAATVLRGRGARFLPGAFAWLFAGVIALHAMNPDGFIARVNLERDHDVVGLDAWHLFSLSDDALPSIAAHVSALQDPGTRAIVCTRVRAHAQQARDNLHSWSPLSFSLALYRASEATCD